MISRVRGGMPAALAGLILLAGCTGTSGRIDPFPGKTGRLHPEWPVVGVLPFDDKRDHPDRIARWLRTLPPPRVLMREAVVHALHKNGITGFMLTAPPVLSQEETVVLARAMKLRGVLSGRIIHCEEERRGRLFRGPELVASCIVKVDLHNASGELVYSGNGQGEVRQDGKWSTEVDEFHRPMFRAMELAAKKAVEGGLIGRLKNRRKPTVGDDP